METIEILNADIRQPATLGEPIDEISVEPLTIFGKDFIFDPAKEIPKDFLFPTNNVVATRDCNNNLSVKMLIFVEKSTPIHEDSLEVYYYQDRYELPSFYNRYTSKPKPSSLFKVYMVKFNLPKFPTTKTKIKTYLKNMDPVTSRGTETTVQNSEELG